MRNSDKYSFIWNIKQTNKVFHVLWSLFIEKEKWEMKSTTDFLLKSTQDSYWLHQRKKLPFFVSILFYLYFGRKNDSFIRFFLRFPADFHSYIYFLCWLNLLTVDCFSTIHLTCVPSLRDDKKSREGKDGENIVYIIIK